MKKVMMMALMAAAATTAGSRCHHRLCTGNCGERSQETLIQERFRRCSPDVGTGPHFK